MDTQKTNKAHATKELQVNRQKWSPVVWDAGWTSFPSTLIEHQKALGIDPIDMNILLHLAMYWWKRDTKPFPSKSTIADALGIHPRTVQKRMAAMESVGFVRREERRVPGQGSKTNLYHLDGLIEALRPFAQQKIDVRDARKKEDDARKRRKRPGGPDLKLVK